MPSSVLRRAAALARHALATDHLIARTNDLEHRLDQLQHQLEALPTGGGPAVRSIYLGDHLAVVRTPWGGKLIIETRDYNIAPHLLMDGVWDNHITTWMQHALHPGDVFVDVGANIGYFTVLGASLVGPAGRVVAVEAHPALVPLLRRNVATNWFIDSVTVWHRAAWSETATLTFRQRDRYTASSSVGAVEPERLIKLDDTETEVEVPAVRVDELIGDLERVDVLKVDVEGSEVRALTGLETTLRRNRDLRLVLEWSPGQIETVGDAPETLVDLLVDHGMHLWLLDDDAPIEPGSLLKLDYGNLVAQRE